MRQGEHRIYENMTIDLGAYSKLVYFHYGLSKKMRQGEHKI